MTLAEKVRDRRISLGLTQHELAQKMGYASRGSINKIEAGRPVTQKIIVKLADALNCSASYLMGWEDELKSNYLDDIFKLSLTDEETKELVNYANFIVSKRSKRK